MKNFIHDKDIIETINKMAIPMILNAVVGMLIGLIDMAMIGRISLEAFGAVGIISTTINSITGVLGVISVAFNILGAKYKGQDNRSGFQHVFMTGCMVSMGIGLLFFIVSITAGKLFLQGFYGLEGSLLYESNEYLKLFSLTLGLNMLLFMHSALFKILNKTTYLFYGNITATLLNIVFNYIFIFGKCGIKPMGVMGAGLGSVLALSVNLIIYMVIVSRGGQVYYRVLGFTAFKKIMKNMMPLSIPLMGQEVLDSTVIVLCINAILTRIGILEVSIYTFLTGIVNIVLMPMYAYGSTALTCVSEELGRENIKGVGIIPIWSLFFATLWSVVLAIGIWVLRYPLALAITSEQDLITHGIHYLLIALVAYLCGLPHTIYKYSLQGVGLEKWVFLNATIINLMGVGIIYCLSIWAGWGMYGVYIGLGLNYVLLSIRYGQQYSHFVKRTC